ncbi:transcriptional repressor AgaR [Vibrio panuliri]|uniref:DeoR family transcriptional regulator n=1 Tax=Vibrio panuliri TaxID=1381081 RepID=A0A1Q9HJF0_9VIBR|nr:transcriptional repressor AgaR [Vibrio panuliri]KAB1453993.1 DeoR/GlpR transcriptional regulator [Vibrio panuliri]OLQ90468.1 DeoR family transcriptional regulator [Vibrio panuliri]OLQ95982.1 DeoR family transcriptional regulator [Vibrio panuliri]
MTTTAQRREEILHHIQTHQKGEVNYFAERYNVSEVTIRNDLNHLEKRGCVTRCYGGALLNNQFAFDQPLNDKKQLNSTIKAKLGEYAASLINDGDKVILDSGSTTEQIAYHLEEKHNLVIMTNGINIAYHLANQNNVSVMITGGAMRKNSYSVHGTGGEEFLTGYRFNKLFLGVDGFDKSAGVTTPHQGEADINRKMIEAAQTVIAVTDSSKFNRQSFCLIARPEQLNMLITDSGIPQDYVDELTAMGVDVRIVA